MEAIGPRGAPQADDHYPGGRPGHQALAAGTTLRCPACGAPVHSPPRLPYHHDAVVRFAELVAAIGRRRWADALRCQAELNGLGFIVAAKGPRGEERRP